jgi:hypothetical protein
MPVDFTSCPFPEDQKLINFLLLPGGIISTYWALA